MKTVLLEPRGERFLPQPTQPVPRISADEAAELHAYFMSMKRRQFARTNAEHDYMNLVTRYRQSQQDKMGLERLSVLCQQIIAKNDLPDYLRREYIKLSKVAGYKAGH